MALSTRPVPVIGPTINEQFPVASFTSDGGSKIAFPITNLSETGGNRVIEQERAYRDGAKLDDTGAVATRWSFSCLFHNSIQEKGLEVNGKNLYPDVLDDLINAFLVHETGDLVVPTRGSVRVRCESYTRTESNDPRECALLDVVFIEDNEDGVDFSFLSSPSVQATGITLADKTTFSAQERGLWTNPFYAVKDFARNIEGLINAPGDFVNDVRAQAKGAGAAVDRARNSGRDRSTPGRDVLLTPEATVAERSLQLAKEKMMRARSEARRNQPKLQARVFSRNLSLADIAFEFKVDYTDLLFSNPQIENPRNVPAGTTVFLPIG